MAMTFHEIIGKLDEALIFVQEETEDTAERLFLEAYLTRKLMLFALHHGNPSKEDEAKIRDEYNKSYGAQRALGETIQEFGLVDFAQHGVDNFDDYVDGVEYHSGAILKEVGINTDVI